MNEIPPINVDSLPSGSSGQKMYRFCTFFTSVQVTELTSNNLNKQEFFYLKNLLETLTQKVKNIFVD